MKQIICRHCKAPNTPGSKFCNHCGNRLAPSTNYICPNCQTPNPKNRFYCDNCGTRLVQDKLPGGDTPPDTPEAGPKIFSLPTRKPGDTGELDPSTIPDWLRTGKTQDTPDVPEELLDGEMPRIEDLKPEKGDTGDLPDWLTGSDSDPVFDPPAAITTEHYLELIQSGRAHEDLDLDLFNQDLPGASASDAHLPDWLSDIEHPEADEEVESDAEAAIPDWLPDFQQPTEAAPLAKAADEFSFDFDESEFDFDDLAGDDAPSADSTASAEDDWSDQFGGGLTALLGDVVVPSPASAPADSDDDLPDWLQADASPADDLDDFLDISTPATPDSPADSDEALPDWLMGDDDEDETAVSQSSEPEVYKEMTGWLSALDDDEPPADALASETADDDFADLFASDDEFLAWDEADESAPEATLEADLFGDDEVDLDSWLTDEPPATPTQPASGDVASEVDTHNFDDWLADESAKEATAASAASKPTTAVDDDEYDWLSDADASDPTADLFADTADDTLDLDDLLGDDDDFDWISDAGASDATPPPSVAPPMAVAPDDDLDWLGESAPSEASDATADFFADDSADVWDSPISDDIPSDDDESLDWLAELAPSDTSPSLLDQHGTSFLDSLDFGDAGASDQAPLDDTLKELSDSSLPDWLDGQPAEGGDSDTLDWAMTGLLGEDDDTGSLDGLDWLTSPLDGEQIEEAEPETAVVPEIEEEPEEELDAEPDWLTAFLTGDLPDSPTGGDLPADMLASARDDLPDIDDLAAEFELDEADADLFEAADLGDILPDREPIQLDSDLVFAENMIGDSTDNDWISGDEEDLPDWLSELGAPAEEAEPETSPSYSVGDDMPDWLAGLRPDEKHDTGALPEMLSSPRLPDEAFEELPDDFGGEELSSAGLPDWLHDAIQDDGVAVDETSVMMGSMMVGQERESDTYDDLLETSDGLEYLEDVLSELPPADPLQDRLPKADIPSWVAELKPSEEALPEPIAEPEVEGPLVGISGTIAIQEAAVPAYKPSDIRQFTITPEQQQQATLLRQLTQGGRKLSSDIEHSREVTSLRLRLVLAALVVAAILVGLLGPLWIAPQDMPIPPHVAALETAVTEAAGLPVLVAFEYTPAMAGQLAVPAQTLINQLEANNSPVIVVSQSAAGLTLAEEYVTADKGVSLGIVPGEAVGLRLLANCLGVNAYCESFVGRPISDELHDQLHEVALIVLLTGERDSVVNWVEQIGTTINVPIVAVVTEAMVPIAAPYYASGQLSAVMAGGLETAVYQTQLVDAAHVEDGEAYVRQVNAQTLSLLVAAFILLAGGLIFGIRRDPAQKKDA